MKVDEVIEQDLWTEKILQLWFGFWSPCMPLKSIVIDLPLLRSTRRYVILLLNCIFYYWLRTVLLSHKIFPHVGVVALEIIFLPTLACSLLVCGLVLVLDSLLSWTLDVCLVNHIVHIKAQVCMLYWIVFY